MGMGPRAPHVGPPMSLEVFRALQGATGGPKRPRVDLEALSLTAGRVEAEYNAWAASRGGPTGTGRSPRR